MAKLIFLVAVVLLAVALAEASYRTTIITTTVEEEEKSSGNECQVEGKELPGCQKYLSPLRFGVYPCCSELLNIEGKCRCEVIKQIVKKKQEEGGVYEIEEMLQAVIKSARNLPITCELGTKPQQCQIEAQHF